MEKFHRIKELLNKGALDGIYPGAVLLVAFKGNIVFFDKAGQRSLNPSHPMDLDTIFDLASLTKPLATTLALMKCVDDDKIDMDQPIGSILSEPLPEDKKGLTSRLLLAHCAGFADWKPFYLDLVKYEPETRKQFVRKWIMEAPLVYRPGEDALYSDLGFMILEWVIENIIGEPLHDFLSRNFYSPLSMNKTFFSSTSLPFRMDGNRIASTEDCPWRNKIIKGSVHDENAYALGGYSGHSGLFGTAGDVHTLVDLLRSHFLGQREDYLKPETVRTFFTRQDIVK
ncbi:MAG: serine hydrolase, partial [Desulfobacterales bacterium]|nr:serine hydrolase [Desulfobacterales bacterium]